MDFIPRWNELTHNRNNVAGSFLPEEEPATGLQTLCTWRDREPLFEQLGDEKADFREFLRERPSGQSSRRRPTNEQRINEIGADKDFNFGEFDPADVEIFLFRYARTALAASYVLDDGGLPVSPLDDRGKLDTLIRQRVPDHMLEVVQTADIKAILLYNENRELETLNVDDFVEWHDDRGNIFELARRYDEDRLDTVEEYVFDSNVTQAIRGVLRVRLRRRKDLIDDAITQYTNDRGINPLIEAADEYLKEVEQRKDEIAAEAETIQTNTEELHRLNDDVREFESLLQELEQRVQANEADIDDVRGELATKFERLQRSHKKLGNNLQDNIDELEGFEADIEELQSKVEQFADNASRDQIDTFVQPQLNDLQSQLEELKDQHESEKFAKDRIDMQLDELEERFSDLEERWERVQSGGPAKPETINQHGIDAPTARLWEENWLERVQQSIYGAEYVYTSNNGVVRPPEEDYVWSSSDLIPGISSETRREIEASGEYSLASFPQRHWVRHTLSTAPFLRTGETLLEVVPVVYANPDAYLEVGTDRQQAGVPAITEMLDTIDEPDPGVTQVIAIASLTGWSDFAINQVTGNKGVPRSRASDQRVICLVDLLNDDLHWSDGDRVVGDNREFFTHDTKRDQVIDCRADIEEYLDEADDTAESAHTYGLPIADAVERFEYTPDVVYRAFERIDAENPAYELAQLEQGVCLVPT